jgi:hypothetical protein
VLPENSLKSKKLFLQSEGVMNDDKVLFIKIVVRCDVKGSKYIIYMSLVFFFLITMSLELYNKKKVRIFYF